LAFSSFVGFKFSVLQYGVERSLFHFFIGVERNYNLVFLRASLSNGFPFAGFQTYRPSSKVLKASSISCPAKVINLLPIQKVHKFKIVYSKLKR